MERIKLNMAYIFTLSTVLLNTLMIFIIRKGTEGVLSNYFTIIITLVAFGIYKFAVKTEQAKKAIIEFSGILLMFGISFMRFLNRLIVISDIINLVCLITFIGVSTSFLLIAFKRIISKYK